MTQSCAVGRFCLLFASLLLFLVVVFSAGPASAQSACNPTDDLLAYSGAPDASVTRGRFTPKVKPEAFVQRATRPIAIDGVLDDEGWCDAQYITGFTEVQPGDQEQPPVSTEVLVAYDEAHLYLAFIAHDDDPTAIRASLRNRDQIFQDDFIGIILDPYGDAAQAYEIFVNPLGIQGDLLMSSTSGEDIGFDLVYASDGQITEQGYQVEMAIPFSSLRFPDRTVQTWRATFIRTRPRGSREQYSWSAISRDDPCFMCQFGTLQGIEGIKPSTNLDIIPAMVGTQSAALDDADDTQSGLDNGRVRLQPSANLKYTFTPSLSAEATVNPDFSQVESDAARIDANQTFALFFPERRPFFQEGSELFDTWIDVVYTRSINAPIAAGKVTGRFGRTSVAYLSAVDEKSPMLLPFEEQSATLNVGQSASNILRARHTFGTNSFVGATVTDRRLLDYRGSGSVVSTDAKVQFWNNYQVEAQMALSNTSEPTDANLSDQIEIDQFDRGAHTAALDGESFQGYATYLELGRRARHWDFGLGYASYSPTFRTPNGFQTRNDYRRIRSFQQYTIYFEDGLIERLYPEVYGMAEQNFDGVTRETYGQVSLTARMKGQTSVHANVGLGRERFGGTMFERLTSWTVNVNSNFSDPVRIGFNVNGGRSIYRSETPEIGRGLNASLWATLKPMQRLVIQPEVSYATLRDRATGEPFFEGYILRAKTSVQVTRELSARLVTQYNHFSSGVDVEPLVSYQINPFSVFHVGTTHDYTVLEGRPDLAQTSRQVFFKFQYLFRM